MLEEEFAKFVADHKPEQAKSIVAIRNFFKAYATDSYLRDSIDRRQFSALATYPAFSIKDLKVVPKAYRVIIPRYIKNYVPLSQFAS